MGIHWLKNSVNQSDWL